MTTKSKGHARTEELVDGKTRAQYVAQMKRSGMSEAAASRRFTNLLYDQEKAAEKRRAAASARAAVDQAAHAAAAAAQRVGVTVGAEPTTYRRGGPHNFLRDALTANLSGGLAPTDVRERLERHQRAHEGIVNRQMERAASGVANFTGLVVPAYVVEDVAPLARTGRPFADICRARPLPEKGMTVDISRITTGASSDVQASEGSAFSSTAVDDTLLAVPVVTEGGYVDISIQAAMRGVGVNDGVIEDAILAYHSNLDARILVTGDGTSGTPVSVVNTASIGAVTYTDVSPTVAEQWSKLTKAAGLVQAGLYKRPTHLVMHPSRLDWYKAGLDANARPIIGSIGQPITSWQGADTGPTSPGNAGFMLGNLPVVVDSNIPTNLGAGTEDEIIAICANEVYLYEDPSYPFQLRLEQPVAHQGQVRIVVAGFFAFSSGRYPAASAVLTGSGLAAQTL